MSHIYLSSLPLLIRFQQRGISCLINMSRLIISEFESNQEFEFLKSLTKEQVSVLLTVKSLWTFIPNFKRVQTPALKVKFEKVATHDHKPLRPPLFGEAEHFGPNFKHVCSQNGMFCMRTANFLQPPLDPLLVHLCK